MTPPAGSASVPSASAPFASPTKGKAFDHIPLVDISALFGGDETARRGVAGEIAKAAGEVGFLYISGHGIPDEMIRCLRHRAAEFFALPDAVKMKYYIGNSRAHRGYVPVGEENFYDGDAPPQIDKKEAFDLSLELPADDPDHLAGYRMLGPNQWPQEIGEFREDVYAYYRAVTSLGQTLFRGFALALGLPESYFEQSLKRPPSQLRLIHYPPSGEKSRISPEQGWGISPHTDYECFTILHATSPGLEILNEAGSWIEAPPVPGAFVINVGDMLEAMSNGRFIATSHRVRPVPEERFSFPLFCALDYDTLVKPLPHCVGPDRPALYPAYVLGDHLVTQTMRTFSYLRDRVANGTHSLPEGEAQDRSFGRKF